MKYRAKYIIAIRPSGRYIIKVLKNFLFFSWYKIYKEENVSKGKWYIKFFDTLDSATQYLHIVMYEDAKKEEKKNEIKHKDKIVYMSDGLK